eukprot:TRINITY_DN2182_c0_g3_i6.p3 TRINITY_DN2182_c0_g3~~TRINITY_DN2182_c0_g3_i6.p3  ORF type:complete len:119 (+),score=17.06 TRINITY_DN2182_c0_g3_i6:84-440(+)
MKATEEKNYLRKGGSNLIESNDGTVKNSSPIRPRDPADAYKRFCSTELPSQSKAKCNELVLIIYQLIAEKKVRSEGRLPKRHFAQKEAAPSCPEAKNRGGKNFSQQRREESFAQTAPS